MAFFLQHAYRAYWKNWWGNVRFYQAK